MEKLTRIIGSLVVLLVIVFFWIQTNLTPVNPQDHTTQDFIVAPGAGSHQVADSLKSHGLIKSTLFFRIYMLTTGLSGKIQKGDFQLSPTMSAWQIAQLITQKPMDIWVLIAPGLRADEIADRLKAKIPSYQEDWRAQLRLHEGYLFPDTYLISRDATIDQIIAMMTANFNKKWQETASQQNNRLTQEQVVVLASILQREAPSGDDMRKVASVLENRLSIGMALQVDATIQYALGYQADESTWWKKNLTADDLKIDSPYNTYTNPGLPPTPISSPDLEALEAAVNPEITNYFYYFTDGKGVTHFSKTLVEHNANIRKYGL